MSDPRLRHMQHDAPAFTDQLAPYAGGCVTGGPEFSGPNPWRDPDVDRYTWQYAYHLPEPRELRMTAIAVIEPNSQAARYLVRRIGALATGTKLSIEIRVDGVAIKVGEEAWTPTLATLHEPTEPLNEGTYAVSVLEHGGWRQFAVAHGSEAQAILDNSETPNQLRFDRIE